jgi:hypothetical protein
MTLRRVSGRNTPGVIIEDTNRANVAQTRTEIEINTTVASPQLNTENPQPMLEADIQVEHERLGHQERSQEAVNQQVLNEIEEVLRNLSNRARTEDRTRDQLLAMPVNEQLQTVRSSAVKEPTLENYMIRIKKFLNWCKMHRTEENNNAPTSPFNPLKLTKDLPEKLILYLQTNVLPSCKTVSGFDQHVSAMIRYY